MTLGGNLAIVLVGHGSARHPESAAPIHALADSMGARWPGIEASAVFMKQAPFLDQALSGIAASRVAIVPVFAGKGYYTDQMIPRAMGLTGAVTVSEGRTLFYTPPAGTHPRIPDLMRRRAAVIAAAAGLDPAECALLVIAHGSARPGGSGETPRAITAAIAQFGTFAEVALAFLEQEPFATSWQEMVSRRNVIVLPLLVAQGMHASQDIPPLFGLTAGRTGPVEIDGHIIRLASGLGAEPELVDIIAEMVAGAVGSGIVSGTENNTDEHGFSKP